MSEEKQFTDYEIQVLKQLVRRSDMTFIPDLILCSAEYRSDKKEEETFRCVLRQGHMPNIHKTRTGKLFAVKVVEV